MAKKPAKRATRTTKKTSNRGGFSVLSIMLYSGLLLAGVTGGYFWRSYFPLALPIESPLVADRSSADLGQDTFEEVLQQTREKAREAEQERDRLRKKVAELEKEKAETKRELGDSKIKSILQSASQ